MTLDPLSFVHPLNLSDNLVMQGRFEEAIGSAEQAVSLGAGEFGLARLFFANLRNGRLEQARIAMEKGCALSGPTGGNCEANHIMLLAVEGQRAQAEAMLDDLVRDIDSGKHRVGNYIPSFLASLYLEVSDIAKATEMQKRVLDTGDWFPTQALVFAPGGASLPEEISTDPAWLEVWSNPRLGDVIDVYRENLLAWRVAAKR